MGLFDGATDIVIKLAVEGAQQFRAQMEQAAGGIDQVKRSKLEADAAFSSALATGGPKAAWAQMLGPAGVAESTGMGTAEAQAAAAGGSASTMGSNAPIVGAAKGIGMIARIGGTIALASAGYAAIRQWKDALKYADETAKVHAQLGAVLKSTGESANINATGVEHLASKLGNLAGVETNSVLSGETVLLQFTKVKNTVGEVGGMFDKASLAALNMSTRMGVDMSTSAMQIGKALQDPLKGVTALRRAGVTFSDSQMDAIKVNMAAGREDQARAIILGQLTTQFGGAAAAAGKTLPAALVRLNQAWEDARQKFIVKMEPYMIRVTNWFAVHLPGAIDKSITALELFNGWEPLIDKAGGKNSFFGNLVKEATQSPVMTGIDILGKGNQLGNKYMPNSELRSITRSALPFGWGDKALGDKFEGPVTKVDWTGFPNQTINLVVDSNVLATVSTKAQAKKAHAQGRGTAHR
jgi:hypothetical protein